MFITKKLFWAAVSVLVVTLLLAPMPSGNLWWREAVNSSHVFVFGAISFVIYHQLSVRQPSPGNAMTYVLVFIITMSIGIIVEMLQGLTQRDANLDDITRNLFGILAGLCFLAGFQQIGKCSGRAVIVSLAAGSFLLLMGVYPLFQLSWHYLERKNAFPVIIDFNRQWSSSFVRFNNAEIINTVDNRHVEGAEMRLVQFNPGKYPGMSVIELEPDWSGYNSLRITMFSGHKKNIALVLRVHDKVHNQGHEDRFNKRLVVEPGLNEFDMPLDKIRQGPVQRELDLANIAGVILFFNDLNDGVQIELGNLYLK